MSSLLLFATKHSPRTSGIYEELEILIERRLRKKNNQMPGELMEEYYLFLQEEMRRIFLACLNRLRAEIDRHFKAKTESKDLSFLNPEPMAGH